MLRKIEHLLPVALSVIDSVFDKEIKNGGIPSGYQSAASGFGVTLLQMGLLPTLAIYQDEESGAEIDRKKLLRALVMIIIDADKSNRWTQLKESNSLLKDIINKKSNHDFLNDLKESLLQASVAFKLAIRTYKLKQS
jgi:hypothetical protein